MTLYSPQISAQGSMISIREARDLHARYAKRKTKAVCEKLFLFNYGFAVKVAMRYVRPGFASDEAISAASRGLLEALRRYDPRRGAFTTFSYWWMVKFILREKAFAVDIVRLPIGLVRKSRKAQRLRVTLGQDDVEIARQLGVDVAELERLEGLHQQPRAVSIHEPEHDVVRGNLETVPDPGPDPREAIERNESPLEQDAIREELAEALQELSPMERDIVMSRHAEEPVSFEKLGRRYAMSHEGARKIYLAAMQRLREFCGRAT